MVSSFKKTEVKLDLLTNIGILLMDEKGIRKGKYHVINRHGKANNKYMTDIDKNEESSYLKYWDVNNLYGWAMSQKLPVDNFQWLEDVSKFHESFIKVIIKKLTKDTVLKLNPVP